MALLESRQMFSKHRTKIIVMTIRLLITSYNYLLHQVVMNKQRKIIWPGGETERPRGFQMSTRLKVHGPYCLSK